MNTVVAVNESQTNGISNSRQNIHCKLVDLIGENVVHYRNDLLGIDLQAISAMKTVNFIHVSHVNGTHLYELPQTITDDSPVKYLFGEKRPSNIYQDRLEILSEYFGREWYFGYKHCFSYCNGTDVQIVSQDKAVSIYKDALDVVMRDLRINSVLGDMS